MNGVVLLENFLSNLENNGIDTSGIPTKDEDNDKEMTALEAIILGKLEKNEAPFDGDLCLSSEIKSLFRNNEEIQTFPITKLPLRILDIKRSPFTEEMSELIITLALGCKVFFVYGYENNETGELIFDSFKEYGFRSKRA